jgi:hypothetical protein
MSYPVDIQNQLAKLKATLKEAEKKSSSEVDSKILNETKKFYSDLEKSTADLFKILSKVNK